MREIKFRFWDGEKMLPRKGVYFEPMVGLDGELAKNDCQLWKGKGVLMQFTGLKDKNGKEIYEGDIVRTNDKYYPEKIVTYTVGITNEHDGDWDEWCCGFDLTLYEDDLKILHYQLSDEAEVIGNIYENLELVAPSK